ncbi:MAG: glycosyltransferase [Clostridia bacterium]|nr:glycosyltransferase [Clostridia bacterium]
MKVLEINVDDVGLGGVYALVSNVIKNSPGALRFDIACIVPFENSDHIDELERFGTGIHYIGTPGARITRPLIYYLKTRRLVKREKYDCVHIHGDVAYLLLIFALAVRKTGVKRVILHSHAAGIDGSARRIKLFLHKICRHMVHKLSTDCAACSDRAASWMYPDIPLERVKIINNGVEPNQYKFDALRRLKARDELKVSDAFLIGHVGRFAYQKNHEYLLKVFAAARNEIPDAKLLLVGQGVLYEAVQDRARQLGIERDILFYGASDDVGRLMQAMDVFVLPSRFEGLPVVGVEAQASGLPVLFADTVTRQAKITDRVWFLPIEETDIPQWVSALKRVRGLDGRDRSRGYHDVCAAGFSIADTVRGFLTLYGVQDRNERL